MTITGRRTGIPAAIAAVLLLAAVPAHAADKKPFPKKMDHSRKEIPAASPMTSAKAERFVHLGS